MDDDCCALVLALLHIYVIHLMLQSLVGSGNLLISYT